MVMTVVGDGVCSGRDGDNSSLAVVQTAERGVKGDWEKAEAVECDGSKRDTIVDWYFESPHATLSWEVLASAIKDDVDGLCVIGDRDGSNLTIIEYDDGRR
ncbi:hypothetical protein L1887_15930 [Cichorium endivia]|nr:hypothetical protein L1887_15930 [Cichorium endivia]